jgi:hypothetical protein
VVRCPSLWCCIGPPGKCTVMLLKWVLMLQALLIVCIQAGVEVSQAGCSGRPNSLVQRWGSVLSRQRSPGLVQLGVSPTAWKEEQRVGVAGLGAVDPGF